MSSAFLLSANSLQSNASLLESICSNHLLHSLKNKADCCGLLRPRLLAPSDQCFAPLSPASESATRKPPAENPPTFARGMAPGMPGPVRQDVESPRIPPSEPTPPLR